MIYLMIVVFKMYLNRSNYWKRKLCS